MSDRIGALWIKEGRNGKFMSGNIEVDGQKIDVVVFKNDKGDNPKRPDYSILKSQPRDSAPKREPEKSDNFQDDIPF